jgi:RNA polymerase sigma-70 factor (ECF subfamily)
VEGRPPPPSETDLVRRAKEGDLAAYEQLLRAHEGPARRLAHLLCGPDGDDAAQDAFVKGWSALGSYRGESPFRGWLLRIVANEARNRRRSAGRRRDRELRLAVDRASVGAAPSPEAAVLAAERRRVLMAAVDALPERLRDAVVCRHLAGLSEAETARVLDIPAGTVKSRLARGLDRLRATVEDDRG